MSDLPTPRIREGFPGQRMFVLPRPVVQAALHTPAFPPPPDALPTDIGCFPDAANHHVPRPEGSPQLILIYCVRGQGWARLGAAGQELTIHPGRLLLIPPHTPHAYGCAAAHPWSIYWLHVAGKRIASLHKLLSDDHTTPLLTIGESPTLLLLFEEILDTLRRSYGTESLLAASLATGHLLGHLLTLRHRRTGNESTTPHERIDHAIQFIQSRLASRISVPELARLSNLSVSHFAALFKKHTGYAVLEYLTRLRMQRAGQLLDTTDLPIKVIAADVGFQDPLYFSRTFRRIHALSPAQYRAIKKG